MLGAMILYSCACSQKKFEPCHNMNQSEVGQFSSDMLRKAAEYAHFNKQRENNVLSQQLAAMQMGGSSSVQNTPQQQGTLSSSSHGNFFEKNTLKIFLRILHFFHLFIQLHSKQILGTWWYNRNNMDFPYLR